MKIADGFMLRQIADSWVVVPIGEKVVAVGGMLSLNESSALLWQSLEQGADEGELAELLCAKYAVAPDTALDDVREFLQALRDDGVLLEDD